MVFEIVFDLQNERDRLRDENRALRQAARPPFVFLVVERRPDGVTCLDSIWYEEDHAISEAVRLRQKYGWKHYSIVYPVRTESEDGIRWEPGVASPPDIVLSAEDGGIQIRESVAPEDL